MNIIETLPKTFEHNGVMYTLSMHVTAFDKLCICYREMFGERKILCSVCVEPNNDPIKIENTIGTINEYVGNARSLDDAAKMLKDYVNKTYIYIKKPKTFWEFIGRINKEDNDRLLWTYAMNLGQKYHNEGKNPDDYLDEIMEDVNNTKQNL